MSQLFVTGASGGLGSHLVREAGDQGWTPTALVRPATVTSFLDLHEIRQETDWRSALRSTDSASAIVHLAAYVHRRPTTPDFEASHWYVNHELTMQLANEAIAAGVQHFIFVSTVAVYGRSIARIDSGTSPNPSSAYGASKLAAENDLATLFKQSNSKLTILRLPMTYGPRVRGNLLPLLNAARRGRRLPLGAATRDRSFLYVENFVDAVLHLISQDSTTGSVETYLMCDQQDLSPKELYERLFALMGGHGPATIAVSRNALALFARLDQGLESSRLASVPVPTRPVGRFSEAFKSLFEPLTVDATAIKGWTPRIDLDVALGRTVDAYLSS